MRPPKENMSDFLKIIETIQLGKNFLAVPHVNIDGDDLGSMLALYWGFKKINKRIELFTADNIPYIYTFLPGVEKIKKEVPSGQTFDAAIILECSAMNRIAKNLNLTNLTGKIINIDHHPDNTMYGDLNYLNSRASALGEIIFYILKALDIELDLNIAVNLYTSILTDSGGFQYSNTTSDTHKIISELLKFPVPVNEISRKIYKEVDFNSLKLLGFVLTTLSSKNNGKVVWAELTQKMLKDTHNFEENTQHFIDEIKNVTDAEISFLLKETPEGHTKVSLRSNIFPVNDLAARFDGGGHRPAAGCTIKEPLFAAKKLLLEKIDEMFYEK